MSGYRGNPEFSASIVDAFINRKHLKGFIGVVALIVMIVGSLFAWFYFLALGGEKGQKIILMEAVIYGAILVISLVFLFVIGYERSALTFLRISYIAGVVLSVAGFYVLGIGLMAQPEKPQGEYFFYILQFLLYGVISAFMAAIPILIICGIRAVIIRIFDTVLK